MRTRFHRFTALAVVLGLLALVPVGGVRAESDGNTAAPSGASPNSGTAKAATIAAPVQVLVLGTYHMGNPGQDLHNLEADDVTTPKRQAEIAAVAKRLAGFRPTKVMMEFVSDAPDRRVARYEKFTPADLATSRDERVQIGFRIAREFGHAHVYGIDEQSESIDYFPFDKVMDYAKSTGREDVIAGPMREGAAFVAKMAEIQKTGSVGDLLRWLNDPRELERGHRAGYLGVVSLGGGNEFPGADLNAMWFLRNAKIFAKLTEVATPGDRVLVVFGAGHAYWLRELARGTPGFTLVEANAYLGGDRSHAR
jgi:hypothetical protein